MPRMILITVNGTTFPSRVGEIVLDAALMHGIDFPHDCRAGRCGSCRASIVQGLALGGNMIQQRTIHACQARILTDLELQFERLPPLQSVPAKVSSLKSRGDEVVEVGLVFDEHLHTLPGQYCKFRFRGFPERCFSPTLPADGQRAQCDLTLHVKRVQGGRVSMALGTSIVEGHKLWVEGPFGSAFYRSNGGKRLVLIASGTGFAPIYSVAMAALAEDFERDVLFIVGGRRLASLYMVPALARLQRFPNLRLILTVGDLTTPHRLIRQGSPADHVPLLTVNDTVYAAGAPAMINRVARIVEAAGADLYSDPFEQSVTSGEGWFQKAFHLP